MPPFLIRSCTLEPLLFRLPVISKEISHAHITFPAFATLPRATFVTRRRFLPPHITQNRQIPWHKPPQGRLHVTKRPRKQQKCDSRLLFLPTASQIPPQDSPRTTFAAHKKSSPCKLLFLFNLFPGSTHPKPYLKCRLLPAAMPTTTLCGSYRFRSSIHPAWNDPYHRSYPSSVHSLP